MKIDSPTPLSTVVNRLKSAGMIFLPDEDEPRHVLDFVESSYSPHWIAGMIDGHLGKPHILFHDEDDRYDYEAGYRDNLGVASSVIRAFNEINYTDDEIANEYGGKALHG